MESFITFAEFFILAYAVVDPILRIIEINKLSKNISIKNKTKFWFIQYSIFLPIAAVIGYIILKYFGLDSFSFLSLTAVSILCIILSIVFPDYAYDFTRENRKLEERISLPIKIQANEEKDKIFRFVEGPYGSILFTLCAVAAAANELYHKFVPHSTH